MTYEFLDIETAELRYRLLLKAQNEFDKARPIYRIDVPWAHDTLCECRDCILQSQMTGD